jgi:hypothetical protein
VCVCVWVCLSLSYITTDGQSASLSWYQAPIWGFWPDFYYCQTIVGFWYGVPSLTRGRVCLLQCTIYNLFYCLRFETPPTWRTRSLYLYPPGTGWPGYTPRLWVLLRTPLRTDSCLCVCVCVCVLSESQQDTLSPGWPMKCSEIARDFSLQFWTSFLLQDNLRIFCKCVSVCQRDRDTRKIHQVARKIPTISFNK